MLRAEHSRDGFTRILDELGLCHGACRVDIAVVNGSIHGYEIKSDSDTLDRLKAQVTAYSAVLDMATLVVGERLLPKARRKVPRWWGLLVAAEERGKTSLFQERLPSLNPKIDPAALAQLLWRTEAVEILSELRAPSRLLRSPRALLYSEIITRLNARRNIDPLRELVRDRLRTRTNWRDQQRPSSRADLLRPKPMC
jgi:hypothetical protein